MQDDKSIEISELSKLVRDHRLQILDITLSSPNIFEILGVSSYEIRHSNFLAWLLTPNESHQLGDIFLKWFLKDIFTDGRLSWIDEFKVDGFNTKEVIVHREYNYIDILIESDDFVVVIENKFGSKEHSDQLNKYKLFVEKTFRNKHRAYVFLTPTGETPASEEDGACYISTSYEVIINNLEKILEVYSDSISQKIINILEDYISSVRRKVMRDDEAIQIAHEIYKNHRRALDFIFENKLDHFAEILPIIEKTITEKGYVLTARNKYFSRFTTVQLSENLKKSSVKGWSDSSSFAFEFNFRGGYASFAVVIAPNEPEVRDALKEAVGKVTGKHPSSKQWSTMFSKNYKKYKIDEMREEKEIRDAISDILKEHHDLILKVEESILCCKF